MSKRNLKLWLPVILWMGLIFLLSNMPDLKTDLKEDYLLRKLAHMTEYLILTFFLYRAFKETWKNTFPILYIYPALISVLYAASDEFHQTFIHGRSGSLHDVFIDSIGILLFYVYLRIIKRPA